MAIQDDPVTFPIDVPQPLPIPPDLTYGERKIWPIITRDLIDAGVKVLPTYRLVLKEFCREVEFLGQIRQAMAKSGGLDRKTTRAALKQESDLIKQICLLAGRLHLPQGDLGRYLTGHYWKRKGRRDERFGAGARFRVPAASASLPAARPLFDQKMSLDFQQAAEAGLAGREVSQKASDPARSIWKGN
jgi:hypothetical protein